MQNTIDTLLEKRPWIAHIDDERGDGSGIIVTLKIGWWWADETDCGVRGFDTMTQVKRFTTKPNVIFFDK